MYSGTELRVSIEDQVMVVRAFGKSFAQLLYHPSAKVPDCIEACRQIELGLFLASIANAAPPTS
jgi:hypothetical protein